MGSRNCVIIHGCVLNEEEEKHSKTRTYDKHWIPWVKKELISNNIETETPLMPLPWEPDYEGFKKEFEKYEVNEDTVLIGHSCGCAFLVRWLGETKREVSKLILVAPWKIAPHKDDCIKKFYTYKIDETIKERVNSIVMFTSDNEEGDGKKSLEIFHNILGGEIVSLKDHGHYVLGQMGTEEFTELVDVVLE